MLIDYANSIHAETDPSNFRSIDYNAFTVQGEEKLRTESLYTALETHVSKETAEEYYLESLEAAYAAYNIRVIYPNQWFNCFH